MSTTECLEHESFSAPGHDSSNVVAFHHTTSEALEVKEQCGDEFMCNEESKAQIIHEVVDQDLVESSQARLTNHVAEVNTQWKEVQHCNSRIAQTSHQSDIGARLSSGSARENLREYCENLHPGKPECLHTFSEAGLSLKKPCCVAVIGAGGFIASWIVKLLLQRGFYVRGTLRHLDDENTAHLRSLEGASERLELLRANILHLPSLVGVVEGCEGVFHTACPVLPTISDPEISVQLAQFQSPNQNLRSIPALVLRALICAPEHHKFGTRKQVIITDMTILSSSEFNFKDIDRLTTQAQMLRPAVEGTMNVLRACAQAHVKRVVMTSSIGTVYMNPNNSPAQIFDENCWSDENYLKDTKEWYCLAKLMAERTAWDYANSHNVNLVTICPGVTLGTMLQPRINQSSIHILKYLDGSTKTYANLCQAYVDVEDAAEAHVLAFVTPTAKGRYLCCKWSRHRGQVVEALARMCPQYPIPTRCKDEGEPQKVPLDFCNHKVEQLGLQFTSFDQTLSNAVSSLQAKEILHSQPAILNVTEMNPSQSQSTECTGTDSNSNSTIPTANADHLEIPSNVVVPDTQLVSLRSLELLQSDHEAHQNASIELMQSLN